LGKTKLLEDIITREEMTTKEAAICTKGLISKEAAV